MINPYLIVGLIVFWLASCAGVYFKAIDIERDACKARQVEAIEATLKQAREDSVIDMMAATEAEAARHKSRIVYRDRIVKVKESINEIPTSCAIPAAAVGMFNDAIRNANDSTPTPKSVPLPADPAALKRVYAGNGA